MFDILVIRGIVAMVLIAFVSATIGSFSVFRGSTFFVSGIAHGALAGAALGIFISLSFFAADPLIVALIFSVFIALAIGYASYKKENVDIAIGVMFAFSMSLAVLFLSMIREYASVAWGLIIGDVLLLSSQDINILMISVLTVLIIFLLFYRRILYVIFDPESAEASGLHIMVYETLLFVLIAVGVVALLKCVGAILVYALLVVPAASSRRLSNSIEATILGAFVISIISGLGGIFLSLYMNVAPSALAGLIASSIYAISLFKK